MLNIDICGAAATMQHPFVTVGLVIFFYCVNVISVKRYKGVKQRDKICTEQFSASTTSSDLTSSVAGLARTLLPSVFPSSFASLVLHDCFLMLLLK